MRSTDDREHRPAKGRPAVVRAAQWAPVNIADRVYRLLGTDIRVWPARPEPVIAPTMQHRYF